MTRETGPLPSPYAGLTSGLAPLSTRSFVAEAVARLQNTGATLRSNLGAEVLASLQQTKASAEKIVAAMKPAPIPMAALCATPIATEIQQQQRIVKLEAELTELRREQARIARQQAVIYGEATIVREAVFGEDADSEVVE